MVEIVLLQISQTLLRTMENREKEKEKEEEDSDFQNIFLQIFLTFGSQVLDPFYKRGQGLGFEGGGTTPSCMPTHLNIQKNVAKKKGMA